MASSTPHRRLTETFRFTRDSCRSPAPPDARLGRRRQAPGRRTVGGGPGHLIEAQAAQVQTILVREDDAETATAVSGVPDERFIAKLGWRDERSHVLPERIKESGLTGKPIETLIDHIEFDEGRDPVAERAWEKI